MKPEQHSERIKIKLLYATTDRNEYFKHQYNVAPIYRN